MSANMDSTYPYTFIEDDQFGKFVPSTRELQRVRFSLEAYDEDNCMIEALRPMFMSSQPYPLVLEYTNQRITCSVYLHSYTHRPTNHSIGKVEIDLQAAGEAKLEVL